MPFGPAVCRCSYACALHVVVVLLCVVVGASSVFWSFLMFSPSLLPLLFHYNVYYCYYSTELPALCDGCLGWGWVWRAGLVAGLRVGQAFGMFLLPGFGVGSSSPWVPGHPTSMCDSGVNSLCPTIITSTACASSVFLSSYINTILNQSVLLFFGLFF